MASHDAILVDAGGEVAVNNVYAPVLELVSSGSPAASVPNDDEPKYDPLMALMMELLSLHRQRLHVWIHGGGGDLGPLPGVIVLHKFTKLVDESEESPPWLSLHRPSPSSGRSTLFDSGEKGPES